MKIGPWAGASKAGYASAKARGIIPGALPKSGGSKRKDVLPRDAEAPHKGP